MMHKEKVWFKKTKVAYFLGDKGCLNGESVVEIQVDGEKWLVRRAEVETEYEKLIREANEWLAQIKPVYTPKMPKVKLAEAIGISVYILNRRLKRIGQVFSDFDLTKLNGAA